MTSHPSQRVLTKGTSSNRSAPIWVLLAIVCFWVGATYEFLYERTPLFVSVGTAVSMLIVLGYAIYHCWTNANVPFRMKLNWFGGIALVTIFAATAYVLWWHFYAARQVSAGISTTEEESATLDRLQRLTSRRVLGIVRMILIVAWMCCIAMVVLLFRGSFLMSTEVMIPMLLGLLASAIAMIWAVRVIEVTDEEMSQNERLLWIFFVAATWVVGATLAWLKLRQRAISI